MIPLFSHTRTGLRFNRGVSRGFACVACLAAAGSIAAVAAFAAGAPLPGWKHSGTLMLLTTTEGANLAAGAVVEEFPVLVRLDRDWFDFTQARPDGADVRFSTADGKGLPHQIEEWDAKGGISVDGQYADPATWPKGSAALAQTWKVGDPLDPRNRLAAMIEKQHLDKVPRYIEAGQAEGAKLVLGGNRILQETGVSVNCFSEGDITTPFGGFKQSGFAGRDKSTWAHEQYTELLRRCGDGLGVFCGCDTIALESLMVGALGWVGGVANVLPASHAKLYELVVERKDYAAARKLFFDLPPSLELMEGGGKYTQWVKAACGLMGHPVGAPRAPVRAASAAELKRLRTALAVVPEAQPKHEKRHEPRFHSA